MAVPSSSTTGAALDRSGAESVEVESRPDRLVSAFAPVTDRHHHLEVAYLWILDRLGNGIDRPKRQIAPLQSRDPCGSIMSDEDEVQRLKQRVVVVDTALPLGKARICREAMAVDGRY